MDTYIIWTIFSSYASLSRHLLDPLLIVTYFIPILPVLGNLVLEYLAPANESDTIRFCAWVLPRLSQCLQQGSLPQVSLAEDEVVMLSYLYSGLDTTFRRPQHLNPSASIKIEVDPAHNDGESTVYSDLWFLNSLGLVVRDGSRTATCTRASAGFTVHYLLKYLRLPREFTAAVGPILWGSASYSMIIWYAFMVAVNMCLPSFTRLFTGVRSRSGTYLVYFDDPVALVTHQCVVAPSSTCVGCNSKARGDFSFLKNSMSRFCVRLRATRQL